MILSDRDIQRELDAGRILIEPSSDRMVQPSSIDVRVGHQFRVFANHRHSYIDVRQPMEDLTEMVEATDDEPFILHPGEFVLASTLEKVTLPDDLVARLEGKSSLGRLGLLIHSSLPRSEQVLFRHDGRVTLREIGELVDKRLAGSIVAFDPETFEVAYHEVTGWYEGPPDRIYEVVLASGRRVRVTAGHNLFGLDRDGELRRIRTGELRRGTHVALPGRVPDPLEVVAELDLMRLAPEAEHYELVCEGPAVRTAFRRNRDEVCTLLRQAGFRHVDYYELQARLPLPVAKLLPELFASLGGDDVLRVRGGRHGLPVKLRIDAELAWLLGLYTAEGYRRRTQVVWSNTDQSILDRAQAALAALGLSVYRSAGAITCCSAMLSSLLGWLGIGSSARTKRVPSEIFGWPRPLLEAFVEGFVDGDGSREATRTSLWSSSAHLIDDLLLIAPRLGHRASACYRSRSGRPLYQISVPHREHKLLTSVPLPDQLLVRIRREAGLTQRAASQAAGYRNDTDLSNIENRQRRDAVRLWTLRRLRRAYGERQSPSASMARLDRLVDGDLLWDRVVDVRDTGTVEAVYDLEVRPGGRKVENFLAGGGGVFVSNTAGFVDAGWSGYLTLELSNVATLPIAIYPGMKIGQLAFFRLSSPAEHPYGSGRLGSKYQGQQGPTASRYFENFRSAKEE